MATREVPEDVQFAAAMVRHAISVMPQTKVCPRCDGDGYLDREDWVVTENDGRRVCFKCRGTCEVGVRYPDPLKVRYAVAHRLRPLVERGSFDQIYLQQQQSLREDKLYWPVLEDVYKRAINAARRVAYLKRLG